MKYDKKMTSLLIAEDVMKNFKVYAITTGKSVSQLVEMFMRKELENQKEKSDGRKNEKRFSKTNSNFKK